MPMKQNLIVVKSVIEVWSLLFLRYLVILLVYLPFKIKAALVNSLVKVLLNCPLSSHVLTHLHTNQLTCVPAWITGYRCPTTTDSPEACPPGYFSSAKGQTTCTQVKLIHLILCLTGNIYRYLELCCLSASTDLSAHIYCLLKHKRKGVIVLLYFP